MDDILGKAANERHTCLRLATGHRRSGEYHRKWNVRLGGASEAISAIAGTSVFASLLTAYGVSKDGKVELPNNSWQLCVFIALLLISMVGPALSAVRRVKTDAEDSANHISAASDCMAYEARFDSFIWRYSVPDGDPAARREQAIKELEAIRKEFCEVVKKHISLTDTALKEADDEIKERGAQYAGGSLP